MFSFVAGFVFGMCAGAILGVMVMSLLQINKGEDE